MLWVLASGFKGEIISVKYSLLENLSGVAQNIVNIRNIKLSNLNFLQQSNSQN